MWINTGKTTILLALTIWSTSTLSQEYYFKRKFKLKSQTGLFYMGLALTPAAFIPTKKTTYKLTQSQLFRANQPTYIYQPVSTSNDWNNPFRWAVSFIGVSLVIENRRK